MSYTTVYMLTLRRGGQWAVPVTTFTPVMNEAERERCLK